MELLTRFELVTSSLPIFPVPIIACDILQLPVPGNPCELRVCGILTFIACYRLQSPEEAKKIGIRACVDKLGFEFVKKYNETSCTAYGDEEDHAFCFVGVGTDPVEPWTGGPLILDDSPKAKFPFSASCNVAYIDGTITFLDCVLPALS